jgi:raffinose/stachyose/melibiose transport system substrate-binding protein
MHSMRSGKKATFALAVVATAALGLSACGAGSDEASGDTVVTMAMLGTYKAGFDTLIPEFEEANPGITIKPNYYSAAVYAQTVPTQIAGGNGSDLIYVGGGDAAESALRLGEAGHLADLSNESWSDTVFEPTRPVYEVDGKLVARDLGMSTLSAIEYDIDYFEEAGVDVPTDFDGLLDMCRAIVEEGDRIPIAWGGGLPAVNYNNLVSVAGNTFLGDDPGWVDQLIAGEVTWSETPGWRDALQYIVDMKDAGCFSPDAASLSFDQMLAQLASGQAASMFTYGGLIAAVKQQTPDLNIGIFAPPAENADDTWLTVQPAGGISLWSRSSHADAAKLFLDFISGEEQQRVLAETNVLISPSDGASGKVPEAYAGVGELLESGRSIPSDAATLLPNLTEVGNVIGASVQGLFTGQRTIDQVLTDMDSAPVR